MISKGASSFCISEVRSILSDTEVLHRYFNIDTLPVLIQSPLRTKDEHPSLSIFYMSHKSIIGFKDFGSGQSGDLYTLLSMIWNISREDVFKRIIQDYKDNIKTAKGKNRHILKVHKSDLKVTVRKWKSYDFEFWNTFGISKKFLEFGDIYPISHIHFIYKDKTAVIPADKYAYVYIERKDNKVTMKIYQPFNSQYKWFNNHDSSVWDLWDKLPESGETLIITSSRKDSLCIWENTNIPSVSMQGEGYIPKKHVIQQLKDRFKNVYILYDNDYTKEENYGRMYGKTIADMFDITQIEIPEELESKDISDLCKNHGRDKVRQVIYQLIKKI